MSRGEVLASSFRDPRGFVFRVNGVLFRQVNDAHRDDFELMESSGLLDALAADDALISHEDADLGLAPRSGAYRVIRPRVVPFVSYPYEWCFSELRDAALHTLAVQRIAMTHGMSLRDASAYNIQFLDRRPVLIDTLSFERLVPGRPWVAYRQFCEHFLAPLALMSFRDVRLGRTLASFIDGLPLDLASRLLPLSSKRKPGLQMHIHLHARSQRKHEGEGAGSAGRRFSENAFSGLISSLERAVHSLAPPAGSSAWSGYYAEADHYAAEAIAAKDAIIRRWVAKRRPSTVWDLGANTGRFARIAAEEGSHVVAFDADPFAVEAAYVGADPPLPASVLPLVMDLTNPSPALGLAHRERSSLAERGPADLTLALALIHHLAIGANVPLDRVTDLLADLGRACVLEWVPKDDRKVREMLRSREDVFGSYRELDLTAELQRRFTVLAREELPQVGRSLLLLERR